MTKARKNSTQVNKIKIERLKVNQISQEFGEVVNDETTTNQDGMEQVDRVIRDMQESDADIVAAVLGPEAVDPQPSTSEPARSRGKQAPKRRRGPRKIQHSGKFPRSAFKVTEKPLAKRVMLATRPSEDYQKEVDELEELCGLLPEDEYKRR